MKITPTAEKKTIATVELTEDDLEWMVPRLERRESLRCKTSVRAGKGIVEVIQDLLAIL